MSWLLFTIVFAVALALCQAEVNAPCTSQDQCASDECCEIINIYTGSKKRQFQPLNTEGTCQKYKTLNEACSFFGAINGLCDCAEGLTCRSNGAGSESRCVPVL